MMSSQPSIPFRFRLTHVDGQPLPVHLPDVYPTAAIGYGDLVLGVAANRERREGAFAEDGLVAWRLAMRPPHRQDEQSDTLCTWHEGFDHLGGSIISFPPTWRRRLKPGLPLMLGVWDGEALTIRGVGAAGIPSDDSFAAHMWAFAPASDRDPVPFTPGAP